jgi:hypothetical protein
MKYNIFYLENTQTPLHKISISYDGYRYGQLDIIESPNKYLKECTHILTNSGNTFYICDKILISTPFGPVIRNHKDIKEGEYICISDGRISSEVKITNVKCAGNRLFRRYETYSLKGVLTSSYEDVNVYIVVIPESDII